MAITVLIPAPMRSLAGNQSKVLIDGGPTVVAVLTSLAEQYPGVQTRIFETPDRLRRFINVYLNGEDIRALDSEATAVNDGDEIGIIPALAGGW